MRVNLYAKECFVCGEIVEAKKGWRQALPVGKKEEWRVFHNSDYCFDRFSKRARTENRRGINQGK